MSLQSLAVILMLAAFLRAQFPVLGSYVRKSSDICASAIQALDSEYSSVLSASTIITCEIQVVSGLNYRTLLTNNSFTANNCYLYLVKRINGVVSIRESDGLDRNCYSALLEFSSLPASEPEPVSLIPQPVEPSTAITESIVTPQPGVDSASSGNKNNPNKGGQAATGSSSPIELTANTLHSWVKIKFFRQ